MLDPDIIGVGLHDAERALGRVLAHRAWVDQRRGWRFTNPSLEQLGLVRADYVAVDERSADNSAFANAPPELRTASPTTRRQALVDLLDHLRQGLAITTDALDQGNVESIASASRQHLREPWAIIAAALIVDAPKRGDTGVRGEPLIVRGGARSRLGRAEIWGKRLAPSPNGRRMTSAPTGWDEEANFADHDVVPEGLCGPGAGTDGLQDVVPRVAIDFYGAKAAAALKLKLRQYVHEIARLHLAIEVAALSRHWQPDGFPRLLL
jgi:hypothetical protein